MSQTMEKIFQRLEGDWSIKRTIQFEKNCIWHAEGLVNFTKSTDNVLHYRETVRIILPNGNSYDGYQEYDFKYDVEKDLISKYRSSEEFMYTLKHKFGLYLGIYKCNLDEYIASYNFVDEFHFTMQYIINGPDKNCKIITEFEKIEMDISGVVVQYSIT